MQLFIKWFAPIITVGVAIFIVVFMFILNPSKEFEQLDPLVYISKKIQQTTENSWLSNFKQSQKIEYYYPINEVYIELDLEEKVKNIEQYKLSASIIDPYQLFCLKEELKNYNLEYKLEKDKKSMDLIIYSKEREKLNSLVGVLNNYQISATLKRYKEQK